MVRTLWYRFSNWCWTVWHSQNLLTTFCDRIVYNKIISQLTRFYESHFDPDHGILKYKPKHRESDCFGFAGSFAWAIHYMIDQTTDEKVKHVLIRDYKSLRPSKYHRSEEIQAGDGMVDKYGIVNYRRLIKALNDYYGYNVEPILKAHPDYDELVRVANHNGTVYIDDFIGELSINECDTTNIDKLDEMK